MTQAERIVQAAHKALDAGPMGATLRPADYRTFIACGFTPALAPPFDTADIGTIKTSVESSGARFFMLPEGKHGEGALSVKGCWAGGSRGSLQHTQRGNGLRTPTVPDELRPPAHSSTETTRRCSGNGVTWASCYSKLHPACG